MDADDRQFLAIVINVIHAEDDPKRDLWVIRVDNWFDHKWLRFSGIGRVAFDGAFADHPGVALDELSQDKLTFPPFSPRRILQQARWPAAKGRKNLWIHPRVLRPSADNLQRRVADFPPFVAVWYSSRTEENARGSIMSYSSKDGVLDAWYASLTLHGSDWRVHLVKGTPRERIERLIADDAPPESADWDRRP